MGRSIRSAAVHVLTALLVVACATAPRAPIPMPPPPGAHGEAPAAEASAGPVVLAPMGVTAEPDEESDAAMAPADPRGFSPGVAGELVRWETNGDGRRYTNIPVGIASAAPAEIVVYATPNGNTIEQTLGRQRGTDESFRYDIQHVLAQVRLYRKEVPERTVALVVLEAPDLSWPTWRQAHTDAPARAAAIMRSIGDLLPGSKLSLVSHSGGGALTFALLNHAKTLPDAVERIAFLDSHYAFEAGEEHGKKLAAWVRASRTHHLVALAYDDRKIRLHGKRVVKPGGGSFNATFRMIHALEAERMPVRESHEGAFRRFVGEDGRVELRVHPNPKNVILHSALVSDDNGLLFALARGKGEALEARFRLGPPRLFTALVDPAPPGGNASAAGTSTP
jgi:pimeloyl-ACP methyl ester carboxylesterase